MELKKIQDGHFRPRGSGRVRTLGVIFQEFPPLESFYIVILIYLGIYNIFMVITFARNYFEYFDQKIILWLVEPREQILRRIVTW